MVIPLEHRITVHGVMGNTAYRGHACFLNRRRTDGQLEFRTPTTSANAARSCYIVDWTDDSDYTVVTGGNTSAARDYTTGRKKATFYADGWFRTNRFWDQDGDVAEYLARTTDTAFYTSYSSVTIIPLHVSATVLGATGIGYQGTLTRVLLCSAVVSGFATSANALNNYNFELLGIDAGSAAAYGRGQWMEFKSIKSRVEAGYIVSTPVARLITY